MYSLRKTIRIIGLIGAFGFVTLSPTARAVDPPPDGGYPYENTAEGDSALFSLSTGSYNTAIGYNALFSNTTGEQNTANGSAALQFNTTGNNNTANGYYALANNGTGDLNTASGVQALVSNVIGNFNTAIGSQALFANTTGNSNTAIGDGALNGNTTGSSNIALGFGAGLSLNTGDYNIDIGNAGVAGESGIIRIGTGGTHQAVVIAGVINSTIATGIPVIVNRQGRLGVMTSSERFKDQIQPMEKASEAILALKPVTFRYKHDFDPAGIPQFGLVAEQVEKVSPDLVARDDQGKPYTVRYEAVNAMLLNEFLKEHRKVEEQARVNQKQETAIAQQQKEIQALTEALKAQANQIQKVSDKLNTQAPRMVVNN